jgi:hypothetical protein
MTGAAGRGALGWHLPSWAVASPCWSSRARRVRFWRDMGVQGRRDGRADRAVTSARAGVRRWPWHVTGEWAGVAMPVGCSCHV